MKLIIRDHFRRWWWALVIALGVYFTFQAVTSRETTQSNDKNIAVIDSMIHTVHSAFIFQTIMWLGLMLMWDFQRGFSRILTSLPVTAKQIGRAMWLASVALPAIALAIAGLLAFLIFPSAVNVTLRLEKYLTESGLITLYLGAMFGALTFMRTTIPDTVVDRILMILSNFLFPLTMIGFIISQIATLSMLETVFVFTAYGVLSILGWFRAEQMILRRAGFNRVVRCASKKSAQHKISRGSGGLSYLAGNIFILNTLLGLGLIIFMTLVMMCFNFQNHEKNHTQSFTPMASQGFIPYIFYGILCAIVPLTVQLRLLRTLPVSPSVLAATFVFLPVLPIITVGVIAAAIEYLLAGEAVILSVTSCFLMLGAKVAIIVPLIVWRGLNTWTYILIFMVAVSDIFISAGLTVVFHFTKIQEHPLWVNLTIFILCLITAFMLTKRLITKSSCAYRPRTMPATAWNMMQK